MSDTEESISQEADAEDQADADPQAETSQPFQEAGDAHARPDDANDNASADAAPTNDPAQDGLDEAEIDAVVEAILFSTTTPLSAGKIAQVAELPSRRPVKGAIERLNNRYADMGCTFRIDSIAGGYQMLTVEEYHDVVSRLFKQRSDSRLSQAALEALAIVAYRQPIIRADVEAIRGVASGEMLRKLMEKNLVKIVGRAEVLGRPMLYGTTRQFLEVFGLNSLDDLPRVEELRSGAGEAEKSVDSEDESLAEDQQGTESSGETGEDQPDADAPDDSESASEDVDNASVGTVQEAADAPREVTGEYTTDDPGDDEAWPEDERANEQARAREQQD
jgi:segregation and condensation protein B